MSTVISLFYVVAFVGFWEAGVVGWLAGGERTRQVLIGILWNRLEIDRSNINLDWVVGLTFECLVIIVVIGIDALAHLELAVGVTVNADRLLQAA